MYKSMTLRFLGLVFLLLSAFGASAQVPQWIPAGNIQFSNRGACDNFAGTCTQDLITPSQSNDKVYLCFGDQLDIKHNGDMNLTGDPVPATPAGVTYIFYKAPPTISGITKADIAKDPALQLKPAGGAPPGGFYVNNMNNLKGNIVFKNDSFIQKSLNNNKPYRLFFAPATFDKLALPDTVLYENNGPCVNVNIANKFEVVYLNLIKEFSKGTDNLQLTGKFTLRGGLPEFNTLTSYTISIVNKADPTALGTVTSGAAKHGATVVFTVPKTGTYLVSVSDGKSCGLAAFDMEFVDLVVGNNIIPMGDNTCVDITTNDFTNLQSMQFSVVADPSKLKYTGIKDLNPALNGTVASIFNTNSAATGSVSFNWADLSNMPLSLPSPTKLFSICYDAIGAVGLKIPVAISGTNLGTSGIELTDKNDRFGGFKLTAGSVTIINNTNALDVVLQADSVKCFGDQNATIKVIPSGGTTPYSFTWRKLPVGAVVNGGAIAAGGTATIPGLGKGDYEITLLDAMAIPLVRTINVYQSPSPLAASTSKTDPTCQNDANGSVTANVIGGTLPYSYKWSNGVTGATDVIDNLVAGTYSVTVTDATGCTSTSGQSIAPKFISFSSRVVTNASCSGKPDGSISINVTGGTSASGKYAISWSTSQTLTATNSTINALVDGTYYVTIEDDNKCKFVDTFFVGSTKQLTITQVQVQDINCFGDKSGILKLLGTTSGGAATLPYIFSWSPSAAGTQSQSGSVWTLSQLKAGQYNVTMTDGAGCKTSKLYTLKQADSLNVSAIIKNESCAPSSDGGIELFIKGGTVKAGNNYTIKWAFNNSSSSFLTGLKAGSYGVTVTDDLGCSRVLLIPVQRPDSPQLAKIDSSKVDCSSSTNGSLEVKATPAPGTTIASYTWNNVVTGALYNGAKVNNLPPGQYIIVVADNKGCVTLASGFVVAPPKITLQSTTLKNPTCPGFDDGQIALVGLTGGNPPYIYKWKKQGDPNFTTIPVAIISNLKAETYDIEIGDQKGCAPAQVSVTLKDPQSIKMAIVNTTGVKCFGQIPCDGTANIIATGGTGSGIYTFEWLQTNDVNVSISSVGTKLCQGYQRVKIRDENCTIIDSVLITAPPKIELTKITEIQPKCFGGNNGSITVEGSGGTPPLKYDWDNSTTAATVANIASGNYSLTISDDSGCTLDSIIFLKQPPELIASIVPSQTTNSTCSSSNDGLISVQFTGGNLGVMTYKWSPAVSDTAVAANLSPGSYTITVSDQNGCNDDVSYIVTAPPPITFELAPIIEPQCNGYNTVVKILTAKGGVGTNPSNYTFSIDDGSNVNILTDSLSSVGGSHIVKVFDPNGCFAEDSIFIKEPAPVSVDLGLDRSVALGDSIQFAPVIGSLLPIDSLLYSPGTYLSCTTCRRPYCAPLEDTRYKLVVIDINGCTGMDEVLIEVDKERNIFVPNVFSPNDDGTNDIFRVFGGIGVTKINFMRVFDRWGELVFEQAIPFTPAQAYDIGWDGKHRGRRAAQEVYVYVVEVEFLDKVKLLYRGDVFLTR